MNKREIYRQKYEAELREWEAKVEALAAHAQKLGAEAKLELAPHVDAAHGRMDAARARLRALAETTDEKWDAVTGDVDKAWKDTKAAVEGAFDALRKHQPR